MFEVTLALLCFAIGLGIATVGKPMKLAALPLFFGFTIVLAMNITWEFTFPPWFIAVAASLLVLPSAGLLAARFAAHPDTISATSVQFVSTITDGIWNRGRVTSTAT